MTDITTEDRPAGLAGVPLAIEPLKRRDFASDQEVRWCPGCGDYAILSTFQGCLLYTSPSPRDVEESRMPSSA